MKTGEVMHLTSSIKRQCLQKNAIKAISLLCFFYFVFICSGMSQGLVLTPDEEYESLESPPLESGAGTARRKYSIPKKCFPIPGDQGQNQSCVGWAIGYAYMTYNVAVKAARGNIGNVTSITPNAAFNPMYLYNNIKECIDCNCGTRIDKALDYLASDGSVPMESFNSTNCTPLPPSQLRAVAANYKISKSAKLRVDDLLNLNELKYYINNNIPIIASIKVNDTFYKYKDPDERNPYVWNNSLNYDKHAVLVIGYDDDKDAVEILNSHGSNWGSRGYGWIKYDSYRRMVKQAFVVPNGVRIYNPNFAGSNEVVVSSASNNTSEKIDQHNFVITGSREFIRKNRYLFTFRLKENISIKDKVSKVIYEFDHPTFINKYVTSTQKPSFPTSYQGWGCLPNMKAKVYLTNGDSIELNFNGCSVIGDPTVPVKINPSEVKLVPYVSADKIGDDKYSFEVGFRGMDKAKSVIEYVEYKWHDSTLKDVRTEDALNNYVGEYRGWGCLKDLEIVVRFVNGITKTYHVNMCKEIGWSDE